MIALWGKRAVTFAVLALTAALAVRASSASHASEGHASFDPQALRAVERFATTWAKTQTVTYRDVKQELLRDGKVSTEEVRIKLQRPARAYLFTLRPVRGREILYDRRKDPRHMTVHPGHFPDVTLSIDIYGSLATRGQHRTMSEVGFDETLRVLRADIARAQREPLGEQLLWLGSRTFDHRQIDGVALLGGERAAREVRVKSGESLFSLARRVDMDPYAIFVANPSLHSLSDALDGDRSYVIPAYRAGRSEYWFDSETGMLLRQLAFNQQGKLYESYDHFDMVLNPALNDADFDPNNPTYGF